jgi:hypothetical protein
VRVFVRAGKPGENALAGISIQGEQFFDVTPAEDVDEIVTEEGAFASTEIGALVDRTPFLRDGYQLLRPLRVNG